MGIVLADKLACTVNQHRLSYMRIARVLVDHMHLSPAWDDIENTAQALKRIQRASAEMEMASRLTCECPECQDRGGEKIEA